MKKQAVNNSDNSKLVNNPKLPRILAITGKGGAGKTTFAFLLAQHMISKKLHPLLIDADPTMSHLARILGVSVHQTIENIRTDLIKVAATGKMDQKEYLATHLDEIVEKSIILRDGFSLLVMGQPKSAGCFCSSNSLLRSIIESLSEKFKYVIIDCEAGLEQIHRNVVSKIDFLIVISDPSYRSLETAGNILQSASQFINCKDSGIIINRAKEEQKITLRQKIIDLKVPLLGFISEDANISDLELRGEKLESLPANSPCFKNIQTIFATIFKE